MNTSTDSIILNSCQYTPVYLIENPGVNEPRSYIIAQNNQIVQRPVSDNLKKFYENSGKLEDNLLESLESNSRPRVVRKTEANVIGNNLKLASFLIPKNEPTNHQTITTNSVVLKPVVVTNNSSVVHTTPQLDINRKIVRIKDIPKTFNSAKILPKIKPKEIPTNSANSSRHTVQLLKLGETYHSLNTLSDDQMKIVNHALKIFNNPQTTQEPAYDPVTNTRFIYKVVSPKDLTVVGNKNKVILKKKKNEIKNGTMKRLEKREIKCLSEPIKKIEKNENRWPEPIKKIEKNEISYLPEPIKKIDKKEIRYLPEPITNIEKNEISYLPEPAKKVEKNEIGCLPEPIRKVDKKETVNVPDLIRKFEKKEAKNVQEPNKKIEKKEIKYLSQEEPFFTGTKVTRSGRKVKFPKTKLQEETPHKPRKKSGNIISCFQCSAEFSSLYRLQRHYEYHPTHIPARIHSNLFHCLLAIIKGGSEADSANIFVQQLEHLITKIKSLVPCLLTKPQGIEGKQSTIGDEVGRLFGMEPGKYNLNMDALSCVKNTEGYCRHNPQPPPQPTNVPETQSSLEDELNKIVLETDDCARINSAEKWPTVSKRMEGRKIKPESSPKQEDTNAKKMKLSPEPESHVDIGMDEIVAFLTSADKLETEVEPAPVPSPNHLIEDNSGDITLTDKDNQIEKISRPPYIQFHSAHFDIRSSPIKSSSTVFRKFKIDPDKIARYEPQIIQPPALTQDSSTTFSLQTDEVTSENSNSLQAHEIFNDDVSMSKESVELSFDSTKSWTIPDQPDYLKTSTLIEESSDGFIKPSAVIEPALLHIKDPEDKTASSEPNHNHEINDIRLMPNTSQSVLTFLDSLGSSVDFQLDLFS